MGMFVVVSRGGPLRFQSRLAACVSVVGLSVFGAHPSFAQSAEDPAAGAGDGSAEIVVTAERRSASVQDVPLAMSVHSGDSLLNDGIDTVGELTRLSPSVYVEGNSSFIRGIGSDTVGLGADPSTAIYEDGVYLSRPGAVTSDFLDVERVEVLKGPQGTLYGRNSTSGAMLIVNRKPAIGETKGLLSIDVGNFGRVRTENAVNIPIGSSAAIRFAGLYHNDSGYRKNLLSGKGIEDREVIAGRASLLVNFGEDWSGLLVASHLDRDGSGITTKLDTTQFAPLLLPPGGAAVLATIPLSPYEDNYDSPQFSKLKSTGLSLTIDGKIGDVGFKSVTAYRDFRSSAALDLDDTLIPFGATTASITDSETFSQEVQFSYDTDTLNVVAGAFYFNENASAIQRSVVIPFNLVIATNPENKVDALAAFGEMKWEFLPSISLIAGLRYSYEKKNHLLLAADKASWKKLTPKIGIQYDAGDILLYATVSNGFKSGGFNSNSVQPSFGPEKIWSYEAGLKADMFDRKLSLSLAAFQYDYSDLQVSQDNILTAVPEIVNAGTAKVRGFEADFNARPLEGLTLGAGVALLDTEYGALSLRNAAVLGSPLVSIKDNQFARAPKFTGYVRAAYSHDFTDELKFTISADANRRSRIFFTPFESAVLSQSAYTLVNARASFAYKQIEFSVYGNNITDKFYKNRGFAFPTFVGTQFGVGEPATYGVRASYRF